MWTVAEYNQKPLAINFHFSYIELLKQHYYAPHFPAAVEITKKINYRNISTANALIHHLNQIFMFHYTQIKSNGKTFNFTLLTKYIKKKFPVNMGERKRDT